METIEFPIPVTKDRQGKLAKDYTLKDWFQKLNEELDELKNECLIAYPLDDTPGHYEPIPAWLDEYNDLIAGEACDLIKTVFSMVNQMGIDKEFMNKAMHECNKKARERGCID